MNFYQGSGILMLYRECEPHLEQEDPLNCIFSDYVEKNLEVKF
jgi:hypothetical protein